MRKYLFLLSFLLTNFGMAQTISYFGLFPTIDHSADIGKKFSYNTYIFGAIKPYNSTEYGDQDRARMLYFYAEAGMSYNITKHLAFTASYVYERQNPFNSNYRNEHRLFQQLTLKIPVGKFEIKNRLRFDERFIQNQSTGQYGFYNRLRYLLGFKFLFNKDRMYIFGYSEAFFNTTPNATAIFDENWSAAQIGFKLNSWSSIETGLLYVGWVRGTQQEWLNQFYLQLTWVTHFDFKKKENKTN